MQEKTMSNKAKDSVIMRVYQPSVPFSENRIPKKLVSGVIQDIPQKSKKTPSTKKQSD